MAKAFRKSTLKVNTYHSPDGTVDVTPERLAHWASEFQRMSDAGQVIPMHWDHSNNLEDLQPISMDSFSKQKSRSAKNSVGRLSKFELADDGQSADIEFITLTKDATEKVDANAVYVSPVIFPEWKDGQGNSYTDVITHMDLVNHPVDHSQGPAVPVDDPEYVACALRMGLQSHPYRLSAEDTSEITDDGDDSGPNIPELLELLAKHELILPKDTDESTFFDRLRTALTATAAESDPEPGEGEEEEDMETVEQPQIAMLSLETKQALAYGERAHREKIVARLDQLLEAGKCTPDEHAKQKPLVGAVKLSLNKDGEPETSSVESWIESRESVPKGTFWDGEEKLKRMSSDTTTHSHPGPQNFQGGLSQEEEDAIVARHTANLRA